MMKFSKKEIPEIIQKIIVKLLKMNKSGARVIAFSGDLGAGKTTLTQELARQLGIRETIVSPTFVIMKFYDIDPISKYFSNFKKLIHIDAYRLDSHEELLNIGWESLKVNKSNLIILEWPERVPECISDLDLKITLSHVDEDNRCIEF